MTPIQVWIAKIAAVLVFLASLCLWMHHWGASGVQKEWDAAKAVQAAAAANQRADSAQQALTWTQQFQTIATHYEAQSHETQPSVADRVATDTAAGALRLRNEPACFSSGAVSAAASRSRAADAAATQALADRVANSIAAVRAGDEADQRERALGQQIIALQAILTAERKSPTP